LYLVSHAFEPSDESRILGLDCHIHQDRFGDDRDVDPRLRGWITDPRHCELVFRRPALDRPGATLHGSFDQDPPTIQAIGERILTGT
jgi:hypothetical protein